MINGFSMEAENSPPASKRNPIRRCLRQGDREEKQDWRERGSGRDGGCATWRRSNDPGLVLEEEEEELRRAVGRIVLQGPPAPSLPAALQLSQPRAASERLLESCHCCRRAKLRLLNPDWDVEIPAHPHPP